MPKPVLNTVETSLINYRFCARIGSLSFYSIIFQISITVGTLASLLPNRIVDASNNMLVPNECGDSSEISLLPRFLLTSVIKNSMLTMNFYQQTYLSIYEYFWPVLLIRNPSIAIEKALWDVIGLSWHPQATHMLETPWIRSVKSSRRNSLNYYVGWLHCTKLYLSDGPALRANNV